MLFLKLCKNKLVSHVFSVSLQTDVRTDLDLARLLAVGIEGHLLGGQLAARVGIVAEVDLPERPSPQELSLSPVDGRPRRCGETTPDDEKPTSLVD